MCILFNDVTENYLIDNQVILSNNSYRDYIIQSSQIVMSYIRAEYTGLKFTTCLWAK